MIMTHKGTGRDACNTYDFTVYLQGHIRTLEVVKNEKETLKYWCTNMAEVRK